MVHLFKQRLGILCLLLYSTWGMSQSTISEAVKNHTTYLSTDMLGGRGSGSVGSHLAAAYIARQFKVIGLEPMENDSYYQVFPNPTTTVSETNIVGFIRAAKPSKKSIVFTAHYDGYGIRPAEGKTDFIYNAAQDNAVGVAALIEMARIYANAPPPEHNLVFVATGAEEFGLFGSEYYVGHPMFPSEELIICLNIDGFNISGPREDYYIFPRQGIDYLDKINNVLGPKGWHYNSPDWVDGLNKSFDTASFLSKGIPALTLWMGNRLKGGGEAAPLKFGAIHSPEDEINDNWSWEGVEGHLMIYKTIADHLLLNPGTLRVTDPSLFTE